MNPQQLIQEASCGICGKPVAFGEARYTVTDNHYDCEFPRGQAQEPSFREVAAIMDANMEVFTVRKPRRVQKPIGQGVIGTKVKKRVFEALKEYFDGEPSNVIIWIQPPEYRGPRWDLACWGLFCEYDGLKVHVHSWATMTHCAKSARLSVREDGNMTFDVVPSDN